MQSLLLLLMAFGKDLHSPFYLNQSLKNTFVTDGGSTAGFSELDSMAGWWAWMKTDFLDKLYWDTWYNGQRTDFTGVSYALFVRMEQLGYKTVF